MRTISLAAQRRSSVVVALATCMVLATAAMTWLDYRATLDWERSTRAAAERRANEVLALLATALSYDMRGVQVSVLLPIGHASLDFTKPYDLSDRFAAAFARFPYPESFFAWIRPDNRDSVVYGFSRSARPPAWRQERAPSDSFPIVVDRDPPALRTLALTALGEGQQRLPFAVFETSVNGVRYQTLVHFIYNHTGQSSELFGLVGMTVNLDWVRAHYFADIVAQIERIGGARQTIGLEILDDNNRVVVGTRGPGANAPTHERRFPLIFADRTLLSSQSQLQYRDWIARTSVDDDPSLQAARHGASRAFIFIAMAALITIMALAVSVHAAREAEGFARMQSAFVSTVSHEMKTPVSLIRLASDAIRKGRYASSEAVGKYAELLTVEVDQLGRLIDNVLSYAKITDTRRAYDFEIIDFTEVIEDALGRFEPRLTELGFEVAIDLRPGPVRVRADYSLLQQAIENIIDNAIKFGADGQRLGIELSEHAGNAILAISDRGGGIPPDEIPRVFEKFYRGHGVTQRGGGLGLAIVWQIVTDHKGSVALQSALGSGTVVRVTLPTV